MFRIALLIGILSLGSSAESAAGEFFQVTKDSLLFSQQGSLVRIIDPGVEGRTWHAFEATSLVRLYAERQDGTDDWVVPAIPVYLCPTAQMLPGLGWKFPDDEFGNPRLAEAIQAERVTVPAGDFPAAWRVEVTRDDQPSVRHLTLWFVANVGLVKQVEWSNGVAVSNSELQSYDVQGLGFFPLWVGNQWQFADVTVPAERRSVGALKGHFIR